MVTNRANHRGDGDIPLSDLQQLLLHNLLAVHEERMFFKDLESRFLLVSAGWLEAITPGLEIDDVRGKTDFDFFTHPHASAAFEDEQRIIRTGEAIVAKIERETFPDRDDAWVSTNRWPLVDSAGRTVGTFGISRNITSQMRDPVTGLANRLALMDRLRQALIALGRRPGCVALLFLDIDGFKQINDTWGHRTGDEVLGEIGRRLGGVSRRVDTVARYGGDEFVLLLNSLHSESDLQLVAERVLSNLEPPLESVPGGATISSSVGGVLCNDATCDPMALLDQGDAAMYVAKRAGGGRFVLYDRALHPSMHREGSA